MAANDPFTQVLQAMLGILKVQPALAPIFQPGNIIDISEQRYSTLDPVKKSPAPGDLPELLIMQSRFAGAYLDSRGFGGMQRYELFVTSDTLRIGGEGTGQSPMTINSAKWAIMQTFVGQPSDDFGLPALVQTWDIAGGDDARVTADDELPNRGARRWAFCWAINVRMYWSRQVLRAALLGA